MRSKKVSEVTSGVLSKRIMQPAQLWFIAKQHRKAFRVIVIRNADWRRDPKRLEQVRDRVAMSDDKRVPLQSAQFLDECVGILCRNHHGGKVRRSRRRRRSFLRAL